MHEPWSRPLIAAALGVVLWRGVTFVQLATGRMHSVVDDPAALMAVRGVMGLVFVACGLFVARLPLTWATPFAWYGLTYGMHWGGPIVAESGTQLHTALLLFYLVVSSALAHSFLLLWLSAFPVRPVRRWLARTGLALPGIALVAGALGLVSGAGAPVGIAQVIVGLWPTLAGLAGLVALGVTAAREPANRRPALGLLAVLLASFLPYEIASALGYDALAPWLTLLFVGAAIAPAGWAHRLTRPQPAAVSPVPERA